MVRGGLGLGDPLGLAALITRWQHAWMVLVILSVGITEPLPARRAVYSRWVATGILERGDTLAQLFRILALRFLFSHRHTSRRHSKRFSRPSGEVTALVRLNR
jgi:hypothetical protein